ncbi:IPT/TIG domain-containing protein [Micromonospora sp. NPDC049101]|uniref:IPT/TIG domain-containing protein n=1 Tax=Micromonospora sp. NPDC049101 TaxID=3155032 RepID=UPI0033C1FAD8
MLVVGLATLGLGTPAWAAPGDASARGVVVDLSAVVLGTPVISADATVGTAAAPPAGGTDTDNQAISLPGSIGVTASGNVEVTATRAVASSSASARVTDFNLAALGVEVLGLTEATATATCPQVGATGAGTTLVGLELFGSAVTPEPNGPPVVASVPVVVPGLVGAILSASLTRVETTTADGAAAVAVRAALTLSGLLLGEQTTIPIGTVIVAEATCARPPAAPTAATITPDEGPQAGGQTVTITGTGFVQGGTTVTIDGVPATGVTVAPNGTSLTAVTPAGAIGPASVVISTVNGTAPPLGYTYLAGGGVVTGLSPTSGPTIGGTTVTITGTGLTGATAVTFGGTPGTNLVVGLGGTSLTVVTPPGPAGPVDVTVLLPGGNADAPDGFTYVAVAPTAGAIAPNQGPQAGGQTVTITGTGFVSGSTTVTFDGAPATDVTVDPQGTSLTAVTPPGAVGPAVVVVSTGGGASAPLDYSYLAAGGNHTVTGLTPTTGPTAGGTTVTITGTGLTGATGVTFDGVPGTGFTVNPAGTTITVVTPPGLPGPVDVTVQVPGDDVVRADGFTYRIAPPVVDALSPAEGPAAGGSTVTVRGSGFVPGRTVVTVCGQTIPASGVTVASGGRSLTFRTPACAAGNTTVTVRTDGGVSSGLVFRYLPRSLPVTGDAIAVPLAVGALLALAGMVLVLVTRRGRPADRIG